MRWPFQRRPVKRDANDQDVIAAAKRRVELTDAQLGVRERQLKIEAIQRVVEGEPDPVTALEVVTLATHRGRNSPATYARRRPEQSPLETLAMGMLQKRLDEDPTDALERILERRERLEEAADRLTGGRARGDPETGNTFVDVARAVANSPLGEAVGQVLGVGIQQRMAEAAAAGHVTTTTSVAQRVTAAPAGELGAGTAPPIAPTVAAAAPTTSGPRPSSFRVGMALRVLKSLAAADRARWILAQADQHPELADLVGPFVSAEPGAVPLILEAFLTEAAAAADPAVLEWVPLVQHFRDNLEWTLETHREMQALALDDEGDDDELDEGAVGAV